MASLAQRLVDWIRGDYRIGSVVLNSKKLAKRDVQDGQDEVFLGAETSHPLNDWTKIVETRIKK